MSCLHSIRDSASRLPRGHRLAPALAEVFATAAQVSGDALDGAELDAETELLQTAIAKLNDAIIATYVRVNQ